MHRCIVTPLLGEWLATFTLFPLSPVQKTGNNGTEKLLSTPDLVSCTNYFMSIEIIRCSVRWIETTKPEKKQSVAKSHCIFSIWRRECKPLVRTSSWGSILRVSHLSHNTRTRHKSHLLMTTFTNNTGNVRWEQYLKTHLIYCLKRQIPWNSIII